MAHWEVYPTQLQGELILMYVDVDWHDSNETKELGTMNWFRVGFEPGPQSGMPQEADREFLETFGDWLADEFDGRGHVVARLTGPGRREFFVYSGDALATGIVDRARSKFPDIHLEGRSKPDPDWQLYREFLCPDAVQLVRMRAMQRTRTMESDGDMLSAPRPVDHMAGFLSVESRAEFKKFVFDLGYELVDERDSADDTLDRPFILRVKRTHALDPVGVEHNIVRLFLKVRELGGEYGGWIAQPVVAH